MNLPLLNHSASQRWRAMGGWRPVCAFTGSASIHLFKPPLVLETVPKMQWCFNRLRGRKCRPSPSQRWWYLKCKNQIKLAFTVYFPLVICYCYFCLIFKSFWIGPKYSNQFEMHWFENKLLFVLEWSGRILRSAGLWHVSEVESRFKGAITGQEEDK